ncbi:MAG: RNA-binding S4 domain-containing protein [Pyrinomonadaceae bacterium]
MRLDLFLKTSRLCARRSLAQKFCDANLVKVNGQTAKSSKEIKAGDQIEIKRSNRILTVRVAEIPAKKQVSRAEASNLYEALSEEILEDEFGFAR